MTAKYGTPYFSNYVNSDMEPSDIRSMCPMTPDTPVVVRSKQNGVRVCPISDVWSRFKIKNTNYEVWTPEGWKSGHPVQVPTTKVLKITLSNGVEIKLGVNHLQPTRDYGILHADELQPGMWLPFSKQGYDSELGSREAGFAIGAYLGDGSHDDKAIVYSLAAAPKDDSTETRLRAFWNSLGFKAYTSYDGKNVRFLRINGDPFSLISYFVDGKDALTKKVKRAVFNASKEFREGLLEGFRATDGARDKPRLYTSSPELRKDLCYIFASLGKKYLANYVDTREGRLGKNPNYRIDFPTQTSYKTLYDEDDQYYYYTIKSIEEYPYTGEYLYCFEIDNQDHLFTLANGLITHNCRLRLDIRELRKKSGGYFGSGESTGSIGVVTINMPRIAYLASDEKDFYKRLDHLMDISARSLKIKRTAITKFLEDGLYPYTKRYLGTFNNHFSTIGLIGMNEVGLNAKWLRADLTDPRVQKFTEEVLNHMRERLSDYQEKYGDLYNLEATPAESTTYRFAKHDKEEFPDIITANMNGTPYYTNSSHLPVGYTEDVFSALDIQDDLQTLYTSGTVFHAFLGEKLPDWKAAATLVRKIAENYKLPYYTMSPTYSVCKDHGYLVGEQAVCPHCGQKTEVYSRITGYYRPVQNWNDGKIQEFRDRKVYNIGSSYLKHPNLGVKETTSDNTENCAACTIAETEIPVANQQILLFKTPTCPNCKAAAALLDKAGVNYVGIDANSHVDLVNQYEIKQAPTLVIVEEKETKKYRGLSDIRGWLNDLKK